MPKVKSLNEFRLDESKIYESEEDGTIVQGNVEEWGVRWFEFNSKDQRVMKEKFFPNEKKMHSFMERLEQKDKFAGFYSFTKPSD